MFTTAAQLLDLTDSETYHILPQTNSLKIWGLTVRLTLDDLQKSLCLFYEMGES